MQNPIFISLDSFELPNNTLDYGIRLAKALNRPAILIDVKRIAVSAMPEYVVGHTAYPAVEMTGELLKYAEERMKKVGEEAKKIWPHIEYDVELGFREQTLQDRSEEEHPYTVVIGKENEFSALNEIFGIAESRIADSIEEPVLVVPENATYHPVKRLFYLIDIDEEDIGRGFDRVTEIANTFQADITIGVISDKELEKTKHWINTVRPKLRYDKIKFIPLTHESVTDHLKELEAENLADWLVFEYVNKNFLQRIFDHYNTDRLILQSDIPVWVI